MAASTAVLLLGAGCAPTGDPGAMAAPLSPGSMITAQSRLRQAIAVGTVTGGREQNAIMRAELSNPAFAEALRRSLATHAMLGGPQASVRLDAEITELRRPFVAIDVEIGMRVRYRLLLIATGQPLFEQEVGSRFTATFSDAFNGELRSRLAVEGAVRSNIAAFLLAIVAQERV